MTREELQRHARLWTTDAARYVIVDEGDTGVPMSFDVVARGPLVVDVDDDLYRVIIERMIAVGVKRVRASELPVPGV